jgi:hypothetical protein
MNSTILYHIEMVKSTFWTASRKHEGDPASALKEAFWRKVYEAQGDQTGRPTLTSS